MDATFQDTQARLARIWTGLLPGGASSSPLEPETDFFEAGGHSLLATRMLSRVQQEFGTQITLPLFYRQPTLDGLARALVAEPPPRYFRFDRVTRLGGGSRKPVYAVVHSNGAFMPLGQLVGEQHPFLALQAADRRSGARLPSTVEEIAAGYVRQLRVLEPSGPYVLLGWCLAGNLAFEAAQQLRAAGERVAAVVLVDTWNPAYLAQMNRLRRLVAERSYGLQIILTELGKVRRGRMTLRAFLRRRNVIQHFMVEPDEVAPGAAPAGYLADRAFDQALLNQVKQASGRYRPRPYDGAVLLIRSSEEPAGYGLDQRFGWRPVVGGGLRMRTVPGSHFSIFLEPAIHLLSRYVREIADGG